jgi:TBC1 domain family member 5
MLNRARWAETLRHSDTFADLQRAVKSNGTESPCLAGLRSICWRVFVLLRERDPASWLSLLEETRNSYTALRDEHLKFIKHPELLAGLTDDPLADDLGSAWASYRKDELLRAEILQDVKRLPDEPFYHEERIQTMILDVLFLYCKLHSQAGGYRQGMHELLAPIVHVFCHDAINKADVVGDDSVDATMLAMLDADFVEHDIFAMFTRIMQAAGTFYEVDTRNTIVEKSHYIHEGLLASVDPELTAHLKATEILPQIFLM